jgi:pyrroloquinoline quinone biosynthesis protein B
VARLPGVAVAPDAVRHVPVEGVVFTDAELDHTLGLALLREGRKLAVWATPQVARILEEDSRLLTTTRAFADVALHALAPGAPAVPLRYRDGAPSGLTVEAFVVAGDPPRFARSVAPDEPGHTVGLVVRDAAGGTLAYAPGCGALDDAIVARLAEADVVLLDGTFWRDDELIALGVSASRAADMGHAPISGAGGSLARLTSLPPRPSRRVAYVHINNTNPILLEDSRERRAVEDAGVIVASDGITFEL